MDTTATTDHAPFSLPRDLAEFRDVVRRIVRQELLPLEREYLASPRQAYGLPPITNLRAVFDEATVERLVALSREVGLWYLQVPSAYGGSDFGMLAQVVILEEFNYTPVPFPVANVPNILYECKGAQKARFLEPVIEGRKTTCFAQSEPDAGSDPGGMMKTTAVRDGAGWVLNGTKMWISNAYESDVMLVQAVTDPEKRQHGGITMFVLDRNAPGISIDPAGLPTWLGPRSAQYAISFDNVRLTEENVLGEVGEGFRLGQRWLTIHDRLLRGPYALGKMRRGLDMSIEWAKQRRTFGRAIADRQAIQWKLVDMHIDIESLRAMTYQTAARADAGEDVRSEAALVKLCAGEWGARCLDAAIQVHGAMGESLELPLTYFFRLLRHAQIGGGTTEIQRILLARKLLAA